MSMNEQHICDVFDCYEHAEMRVCTRPGCQMYLCEWHVGEMIAITVIRMQEAEQKEENI